MTTAIIIFALTYVLMLSFSKFRTIIALVSGVLFISLGMLPTNEILPALDFNVILMIAGTMGLVALFIDSKMPSLLADIIMERVSDVRMAAVALALFAGIISASIPMFLRSSLRLGDFDARTNNVFFIINHSTQYILRMGTKIGAIAIKTCHQVS